jgi:hypothetical protein
MTYDQALSVPMGAPLRTRTGEVGTFVDSYNTGRSVLFTLWFAYADGETGTTRDVHNANCWPAT